MGANETKREETNSFGHSSQDVKRIVQGSDFQFKKLHAKAPQIKGIDSVQGAQGEGNREGGTKWKREEEKENIRSISTINFNLKLNQRRSFCSILSLLPSLFISLLCSVQLGREVPVSSVKCKTSEERTSAHPLPLLLLPNLNISLCTPSMAL